MQSKRTNTLTHSKKLRVVFFLSEYILLPAEKVSEYDQEIPQSHIADPPTAPRGSATDHLQ